MPRCQVPPRRRRGCRNSNPQEGRHAWPRLSLASKRRRRCFELARRRAAERKRLSSVRCRTRHVFATSRPPLRPPRRRIHLHAVVRGTEKVPRRVGSAYPVIRGQVLAAEMNGRIAPELCVLAAYRARLREPGASPRRGSANAQAGPCSLAAFVSSQSRREPALRSGPNYPARDPPHRTCFRGQNIRRHRLLRARHRRR